MSEALRIGVTASALSEEVRQVPAIARQLGFDGLLFDAQGLGVDLTALTSSGRREFRHVLSSQDRELIGLRFETGARGLGPGADVDQVLAQLDGAMEAAKGLLAPLLCVDVGPLPIPPPQERPKPKISAEHAGLILIPTLSAVPAPEATTLHYIPMQIDPVFVAQVDAALADLGRRADRYGVTVALRSDLSPFSALERALRQASCPWFGIDLDPVAMLRDEWEPDEIFSRLGSLVRHVRGHDALRGADRRTKAAILGKGDTNWGELLANLDAAGYNGWITVDPLELPDRRAAASAAAKHLRSLR